MDSHKEAGPCASLPLRDRMLKRLILHRQSQLLRLQEHSGPVMAGSQSLHQSTGPALTFFPRFVPSSTLRSPPLNLQHRGLWGDPPDPNCNRPDPWLPKAGPQGLPTFQVSIFIKGLSVSVMSPGLIKKGWSGFGEIAQPAKPLLLKHENLSLNSRTHLKICVWSGGGSARL